MIYLKWWSPFHMPNSCMIMWWRWHACDQMETSFIIVYFAADPTDNVLRHNGKSNVCAHSCVEMHIQKFTFITTYDWTLLWLEWNERIVKNEHEIYQSMIAINWICNAFDKHDHHTNHRLQHESQLTTQVSISKDGLVFNTFWIEFILNFLLKIFQCKFTENMHSVN